MHVSFYISELLTFLTEYTGGTLMIEERGITENIQRLSCVHLNYPKAPLDRYQKDTWMTSHLAVMEALFRSWIQANIPRQLLARSLR